MKRIIDSCWFGRNFVTGCIDLLLILMPHLLIFSIKGLEKTRAKGNEKPTLMDLPNDILLDVLTRLPIKSLCHIRSVSKTSLSIVDNPFFAKLRLLNPVVEGPQLMLLTQTSSFIPSRRSRFALQSFNKGEHDFTKSKYRYAQILCSLRSYKVDFVFSNLFCFKGMGKCVLVNPLEGEVLDLELPSNDLVRAYYYRKWYGMGFDGITRTHKIVCIVKSQYAFQRYVFVAYVYTLDIRSSSWREIHSVPQCNFSSKSVSAYGDMHWLIYRDIGGRLPNRIISFDFEKDEFFGIPYPNSSQGFVHGMNHLLNVRGCLAIMSSGIASLQIWMLKNYEKKEWELDYKIDKKMFPIDLRSIKTCGEWEHGIFLTDSFRGMFYFWDVRDKSIKYIKAKALLPGIFIYDTLHYLHRTEWRQTRLRIFRYTNSMISLKTFGNLVERQLRKGTIFEAANSRTWDFDFLKEKPL
ncbi:unnamed protein product [Prunus brigantina]